MILLKGNGKFTGVLTKLENPLGAQVRARETPAGLKHKSQAITGIVGPAAAEMDAEPCTVCHWYCCHCCPWKPATPAAARINSPLFLPHCVTSSQYKGQDKRI